MADDEYYYVDDDEVDNYMFPADQIKYLQQYEKTV